MAGTRKDGTLRQNSEIEAARQMFLYGQGDGKRIINITALSAASGLHPNTVRRYVPKWQKEMEEIVAASNSKTLGLHLSAETVKIHKETMLRIESEMKQISWELEHHDDIIETLGNLVEKFAGTDESATALTALDRYLRTSCNKQTLRSQLLVHHKHWVKLSGVESLMDVALTREKTLATGKAKQDLAAGDPNKKEETPATRSGVFARRTTNIDEV